MAKTALITDWIKVATSGRAFDGRTIDPQWLLEMAEDYNQESYTALLWPDHERWYNLGEVKELKAKAKANGDSVELFARLAPNSYYLARNEQKQGLFFSIEVDLDVIAPGRAYLGGLAVTDSPASLGIAPTYFKTCDKPKLFFSSKETANLPAESDPAKQIPEIRSFFDSLRSEASAFFNKFTQKHEETPAMEKWEEALAALREEMNGRFAALEGRVEELEKAKDGTNLNAEDEDDKGKEMNDSDKEKDEEYKRQFAALGKKLDEMNAKFSQAKPGTAASENSGAAEVEPLI